MCGSAARLDFFDFFSFANSLTFFIPNSFFSRSLSTSQPPERDEPSASRADAKKASGALICLFFSCALFVLFALFLFLVLSPQPSLSTQRLNFFFLLFYSKEEPTLGGGPGGAQGCPSRGSARGGPVGHRRLLCPLASGSSAPAALVAALAAALVPFLVLVAPALHRGAEREEHQREARGQDQEAG